MTVLDLISKVRKVKNISIFCYSNGCSSKYYIASGSVSYLLIERMNDIKDLIVKEYDVDMDNIIINIVLNDIDL